MDQQQTQKALIEELGLSELPAEKQEEFLSKMTEVLFKKIFLETMEKLDDQGREEYEKLVSDGKATAEQIEEFLKSKIPNYAEIVQKSINELKEEIKEEV